MEPVFAEPRYWEIGILTIKRVSVSALEWRQDPHILPLNPF